MKKTNKFLLIFLILGFGFVKIIAQEGSEKTKGLVEGGQFIDRFLPVEPNGPLRSGTWGADAVLPRDVLNGIEDPEYSYWGGSMLKGDDGKYHMFPCRWREDNTLGSRSGHMTWHTSEVVHAIADNPTGPYKVISVIGKGHTPEVYQRKDGTYMMGVIGKKGYTSKSLNGPWKQIPAKFQWLNRPNNTSNRTYAVRDDGAAISMNQNGSLSMSEKADENFIELIDTPAYAQRAGGGAEDPVLWKDEVQYHCVYNDPRNRIAYYMRSPDGIHWKDVNGVAYLQGIMKHVGGTSEDWYKYERPKVLLDKYNRPTHMNFAVIDTLKWEDLANDKHSSKNIVLPLRIQRRLVILNKKRLTKQTKEIKVKILSEEGFNPIKDIDVSSLKFGAPELVNSGGGATVKNILKDDKNLIIIFKGKDNGFEDHNFAGKLIGKDKTGELIFGYAKMKPSPSSLKDEIRWHTALEEIPYSGKTQFAVSYRTTKERLLKVDLIDISEGKKVKGFGEKIVTGESTDIIHYNTNEPLNLKHNYEFQIYLSNLNGKNKYSKVSKRNVVVLSPNAGIDKINWAQGVPKKVPHSKKMSFEVKYETKTTRDIMVSLVRAKPWSIIRSVSLKSVEGKGVATVDFSLLDSDKLQVKDECILLVYLSKKGEGKNGRVTEEIRAKAQVID